MTDVADQRTVTREDARRLRELNDLPGLAGRGRRGCLSADRRGEDRKNESRTEQPQDGTPMGDGGSTHETTVCLFDDENGRSVIPAANRRAGPRSFASLRMTTDVPYETCPSSCT